MDAVTVCVRTEADKVTIQWNGTLADTGAPASVQVVLHDDDTFDYIYAPDHGASSASALIGVEDFEGFVRTISDNQQGFALPDTSYTFTYNPPPG
jgi:hypothetical protein